MYLATGVDPTKLMARTLGCESSVSTATLVPFTRFTTPGGRPVCSTISKARRMLTGTFSDGFRTKVLPQAMARGRNQKGTITGKLNGVMAATTPKGCRMVISSMPRATSSRLWPCMSMVIPQATSTLSMARRISARDSASVLPFSSVIKRKLLPRQRPAEDNHGSECVVHTTIGQIIVQTQLSDLDSRARQVLSAFEICRGPTLDAACYSAFIVRTLIFLVAIVVLSLMCLLAFSATTVLDLKASLTALGQATPITVQVSDPHGVRR